MAQTFDLILKGGTVVNHDGETVRDVGIVGARIAGLGDFTSATAARTVDCRGLHILPGVIDTARQFGSTKPCRPLDRYLKKQAQRR